MQRAIDIFFHGIMILCKIVLIIQVVACAIVFVGRYVLGDTPAWADPVAMLCMVWLCILSSALAVRSDSHLRITIIDHFLSRRLLLCLEVLASVIMLAVAAFLIVSGGQLTQLATRNRITGLGIATAWMTVVLPITGVAYIIGLFDWWRNKK
jgi:TRAP-type C4-dicarboxylate transport system permease small subunit